MENFADIGNPNHLSLLDNIQDVDIRPQDDVVLCRYGKSTQHIFKNGFYMMTIDWSKL